ncbi:MAG: hypothetical protein IJR15_01610 [Clostridiales bacterium]|nr:hypothetical protein [Clostridiales bacterium]
MLRAYLYRVRRSALKHPWKFLLLLLFIGIFVIMMAFPTLMAMPNSDGTVSDSFVPRDIDVVRGGLYLFLVVMFNFMFYTGLKNGVVGFSTADVVYHMAGPFTPRFNLILAASGTMQICVVFAFFISTQTAMIYNAIGVSTVDLLYIVFGSFVSALIGYFLGSFFGALYSDDEDEGKRNKVMTVGIVLDLIAVGGFAVTAFVNNTLLPFSAKGALAAFGNSWFIKAFPGGGWVAMIYDGIISRSPVLTAAGAVLVIASLAVLFVVYTRFDLNYYEAAIAYAQKAHDMAEAKRAGVDADTAAMTKRAKVGKEKLGSGEGASALTAIHFLMNKRGSKFFFVNPLAMMYRLITAGYLFFMSQSGSNDNPKSLIISAFMMMILLNAVVYAGGKTVTEFTKHYIYLIPETSKSKLFACLKADIPEMAFDSVLCALLMNLLVGLSWPEAIAFGGMMIVFDLLCEMAALLIMRLLPMLGKYLLMMVRYIGVMIAVSIAIVPLVAVTAITSELFFGIIAGAVTGIILIAILLPIASVVVDRAEM